MDTKICSKCREEKELSEFSNCKNNKDGLRGKCKKCMDEYDKLWRINNHEKVKEYCRKRYWKNPEKDKKRSKKWRVNNLEKARDINRKWKKNNPEKVKENRKKYYQKHKKYYREYNKKYVFKKRKENINIKLRHIVSETIRQNLKKQLSSKNHKSTFTFLPYTVEDLKQHLESQFEPWMNWNLDNRSYSSKFFI